MGLLIQTIERARGRVFLELEERKNVGDFRASSNPPRSVNEFADGGQINRIDCTWRSQICCGAEMLRSFEGARASGIMYAGLCTRSASGTARSRSRC